MPQPTGPQPPDDRDPPPSELGEAAGREICRVTSRLPHDRQVTSSASELRMTSSSNRAPQEQAYS